MKKITFIILLIIIVFVGAFIYQHLEFTYITAKFKELRPIHGDLKVYYKGLVVGKAKESKHSDNFHHTLMKIVLYPKNLHLPSNTTVALKKEKRDEKQVDFLELIYPNEPTNLLLSDNSVIEGYTTVDIETYLSNQHPDDIETMKENLVESAQNLNYAMQGLAEIFQTVDEILKENQKNIYKTTRNVENMTVKIDRAIKQQQIENTLSNIENSTLNVNKTVVNADENLKDLKGITSNINAITCGIRQTLSKNFGGLRLFFGKTIQ